MPTALACSGGDGGSAYKSLFWSHVVGGGSDTDPANKPPPSLTIPKGIIHAVVDGEFPAGHSSC